MGSDDVKAWCEIESDAGELLEAVDRHENDRAVELYRGAFLAGIDPSAGGVELEEWIYGTRELLGSRVRQALLTLAEGQAGAGDFSAGAELAQRAYLLAGAPEPEPEELERLFVLLTAGEHPGASEVRKEAQGDMDLSMSADDAHAALHQDASTITTGARINLPDQTTGFVGRERELSEVGALLARPDCRLVSLVGAGGLGKTRLALQAARKQLEGGGFPDGVVFTPLESLIDVASIPAVVAGALGLSLFREEDVGSMVNRFLKEKRLLLVLDNFEHLLEGASFVRELIESCPQVKLLITSRERLNLEHEWVYPIEGLSHPEVDTALEQAMSFGAVQLFLERSARVQRTFSLTPETLPTVMRICQLVDGMPLALELAASWLRALPVGEIAGEIEGGIDLLESPVRGVSARHRSVRVVFDHSWSLLSEGEREVLRRLAVFRGGFRREAAAVVAGATLPLLARLVDASLLTMSPEGRYDRHPLLAQYTREILAEHPKERADVEERHGLYFLGLVQELEPDLVTLKRKEAFGAFSSELANVRAAWDWAARTQRVDEIARTTPAMYEFFRVRLTEGLEHFGTTFEFFGTIAEHLDETNPSHAGALGTLLVHQVLNSLYTHPVPDYPRARPLAERGIELLEPVGDYRSLSRGFTALGETYMKGEFRQAEEYCRQALVLAREHGKASDFYQALSGVRRVELRLLELAGGDFQQYMDRTILEDLEEYRALNYLPGVVSSLLNLANSTLHDLGLAKARYRETSELAEALGDHYIFIWALIAPTHILLEHGEFEEAAANLREAQRHTEESGLTHLEPHIDLRLGLLARTQGDYGRARELYVPVLQTSLATSNVGMTRMTVELLSETLAADGNPGDAVALVAPFDDGTWHSVKTILEELEATMTPDEFAEAVERGRGMTRDSVVREFLPELR